MFSLIGTAIGFFTSFLPKIMDFFKEREDRKHELKMLAAQAEVQAKVQSFRLDESNVDAVIRALESSHEHDRTAIRNASKWVANISALVRPLITYLFFFEWVALTVAVVYGWLEWEDYATIWDEPTQAIFCAVISFWFGSRSFNRRSHT